MDNMKCEFCNKVFKRKSSFEKHACEKKKRWLKINEQDSRIGIECWKLFRKIHQFPIKKNTSYEMAFITSTEYNYFMRFAQYIIDTKPLNYIAWTERLIRTSVPISKWASDSQHKKWTIEYLKAETPDQAIYRTMDEIIIWSNNTGNSWDTFFENASTARVLMMMERGHISPWFFYIKEGSGKFIDRCSDSELEIVNEFIDPKIWIPKMTDFNKQVQEISSIVNGV